MRIRYAQLLKGCIALIITLAGLYIGQAVWQNYAVDLPLDKALNGISGVESVTWNNSKNINDAVNIHVNLDNTANLHKTYKDINEKIQQTIKNREYILQIMDNRSEELEQVYYDIHYYIQKSIMDGDFPLLKEKVREISAASETVGKVFVDDQYVYLQLTKDENSLYSIVSRNSDRIGGISQ